MFCHILGFWRFWVILATLGVVFGDLLTNIGSSVLIYILSFSFFLQGWLPSYTVETTIIQLTATLVDGKARINFGASPKHTYTLQDAEWSFKRLVGIHEKVGWQKNNNS